MSRSQRLWPRRGGRGGGRSLENHIGDKNNNYIKSSLMQKNTSIDKHV